MVNLLIANTDLYDAKRLVNIIVKKNREIRLVDIVTETDEAMNTIKEEFPDVIIVSHDLYNIPKIIKEDFYNPIVVHSNKIKSPNDMKNIIEKINSEKTEKPIPEKPNEKNNLNDLRKNVWEMLLKLNFNPKMRGTGYLADSVAIAYLNRHINLTNNLSKDLYPRVANKNSSTGESVKWDIIKAINAMKKYNLDNYPELLSTFFDINTEIKTTPKFFVTNLMNLL